MTHKKILVLSATLLLATPAAFAAMTQAELEDLEKANAYYAEENYKKAYKEFRDLARRGDTYSQERLVEMYAEGLGTKQDAEEAYAWSVVAAQDDSETAVARRDELWASLDESDRKGAQKTADKYMSKYSDEALADKAEQRALREQRDSLGTCVGSRLKRNCQ